MEAVLLATVLSVSGLAGSIGAPLEVAVAVAVLEDVGMAVMQCQRACPKNVEYTMGVPDATPAPARSQGFGGDPPDMLATSNASLLSYSIPQAYCRTPHSSPCAILASSLNGSLLTVLQRDSQVQCPNSVATALSE